MAENADELESAARYIGENLSEIQTLADRFRSYFAYTTTVEGVAHWLLQFATLARVKIGLKLLRRLHFIDVAQLEALLKRALANAAIDVADPSVVFSNVGSAQDSSATVGYTVAKSLGLSEEEIARRWRELKEIVAAEGEWSTLVLLDDGVASGTQLVRFFSEMFSDFEGKREHFASPLADAELARLRRLRIFVAVAVELGDGAERLKEFAAARRLNISLVSGSRDFQRALEYGNAIWRTESEANEARALAEDIARALYADKEWDDNTLQDRLLGHGNLQVLTAFSHNVPKSLLPIFWKAGKYREQPWWPLFPERREWQASRKEIETPEPRTRTLARMILSGSFGAAPICVPFVCIDGEPSEQHRVSVIPVKAIEQIKGRLLRSLAPVPRRSRCQVRSRIQACLQNVLLSRGPSASDGSAARHASTREGPRTSAGQGVVRKNRAADLRGPTPHALDVLLARATNRVGVQVPAPLRGEPATDRRRFPGRVLARPNNHPFVLEQARRGRRGLTGTPTKASAHQSVLSGVPADDFAQRRENSPKKPIKNNYLRAGDQVRTGDSVLGNEIQGSFYRR